MTIKKIRAYFDKPNRVANGACPFKGEMDCPVVYSCGATMN